MRMDGLVSRGRKDAMRDGENELPIWIATKAQQNRELRDSIMMMMMVMNDGKKVWFVAGFGGG